jgi:hypothetical protein
LYATIAGVTLQHRFYAKPSAAPTQLRLRPRLASWNGADHPDQVRLRAALADAGELLAPALAPLDVPLALQFDIGLPSTVQLLGEHDLDNYAYPLMFHLAAHTTSPFVSVWCTKQHADASFVRVGPAVGITAPVRSGYRADVHTTASGSRTAYKEQIHDQLVGATELPMGPVSLPDQLHCRTEAQLAQPLEADDRRTRPTSWPDAT